MKVAFCSSEAVPFAKTGGLADVAGTLPLILENLGQEVILVIPKYKLMSNCQNVKLSKLQDQVVMRH